MTITPTRDPLAGIACPSWCTKHSADPDEPNVTTHYGELLVISDDDQFPVTARLELWEVAGGHHNIDVNAETDVPIEHARALGEYLIAAADRFEATR